MDRRLARALYHPMRARILEALAERTASPSQLAKELDLGLSGVAYHVSVLLKVECIRLVRTEPRRGATEHFYTSTPRAALGHPERRQVPRAFRGRVSADILQMLMDRGVAALEAGTLDGHDGSQLSCLPMSVDQRGREKIDAIVSEALKRVLKAERESARRLVKTGDQGITMTFAVAGFESPVGVVRRSRPARDRGALKAR